MRQISDLYLSDPFRFIRYIKFNGQFHRLWITLFDGDGIQLVKVNDILVFTIDFHLFLSNISIRKCESKICS